MTDKEQIIYTEEKPKLYDFETDRKILDIISKVKGNNK